MTDNSSEIELVEQAKTSSEAFGQLYELYFDRVYHFFCYRTCDPDLSYDLAALSFEKVMIGLAKYQTQKNVPFSAWLFRLARNVLIDHSRQAKKRQYIPLQDLPLHSLAANQSTENDIETKLNLDLVKQAIHQMKPKYKEVLLLRFFDQLSNPEIVAALNKKADQIALYVYRGLENVRQILSQQIQEVKNG
ncbi:MAG TPA: RNA polymerase sigma factor [Candidatus Wirthbacteria bacterium]|nr:RNA polymerase sigma factor [Candidatus Wirthbacteria bacterium]